jgi:hypothetical protein
MPTQTVFGVVGPDGSKLSGSGFTVRNVQTGLFRITFDQQFSSFPAVVATQGGNIRDPDTRDGIVVGNLGRDKCDIITGTEEGKEQNRQFSFTAMGDA